MKYLLILLLSVGTLAQTHAQTPESLATALETTPTMEVNSELLPFGKKSQKGYTVYINSTKDMAEKKWKEFLETKYAIEVKKSKSAVTAVNATISELGQAPISVTTHFLEDENGCKMNVFYELNGSFINPKDNPKESALIMKSIKEYQKQLYVKVYEMTLEQQRKTQDREQKALDKLSKEGANLSRDITNEETDINRAEQTIISSEKKISELEAKMKELRGEIEQSKSTIEELKQASTKKATEIEDQSRKVADQAKRIERIKASSDRLSN